MRSRVYMRAIAAFAIITLAGCASGFKSDAPPEQTYVLRAAPPPSTRALPEGKSVILRLTRPLAGPGLETDHIILVQPNNKLSYFAASRWAAPLPDVIEALAVETLRGSGAWTAVIDSRATFPTDYYLQMTIRRFDADYSSGAKVPVIHVAFDCLLGRRVDRELLATFTAEATAEVSENRMTAIVAAFERAAHVALAQVAEQSAAAIRTSITQSPP